MRVASTQHRISYSEVRTYLRVVKVRSKKEWDRINSGYNGNYPKELLITRLDTVYEGRVSKRVPSVSQEIERSSRWEVS